MQSFSSTINIMGCFVTWSCINCGTHELLNVIERWHHDLLMRHGAALNSKSEWCSFNVWSEENWSAVTGNTDPINLAQSKCSYFTFNSFNTFFNEPGLEVIYKTTASSLCCYCCCFPWLDVWWGGETLTCVDLSGRHDCHHVSSPRVSVGSGPVGFSLSFSGSPPSVLRPSLLSWLSVWSQSLVSDQDDWKLELKDKETSCWHVEILPEPRSRSRHSLSLFFLN